MEAMAKVLSSNGFCNWAFLFGFSLSQLTESWLVRFYLLDRMYLASGLRIEINLEPRG